MLGYDGQVNPTARITREDAVVMLGRALGVGESTSPDPFSDSDSVSSYARGFVSSFAARGYIHGSEGNFNPKASIIRAEVVIILDNAISALYKESTQYTVGLLTGIAVVSAPGVIEDSCESLDEPKPERQSEIRNYVMRVLQENGAGCRPYFTPIHLQPFYREMFGFKRGDFSVTERAGRCSIAIPFHNNLTEEEVEYVAEVVEEGITTA